MAWRGSRSALDRQERRGREGEAAEYRLVRPSPALASIRHEIVKEVVTTFSSTFTRRTAPLPGPVSLLEHKQRRVEHLDLVRCVEALKATSRCALAPPPSCAQDLASPPGDQRLGLVAARRTQIEHLRALKVGETERRELGLPDSARTHPEPHQRVSQRAGPNGTHVILPCSTSGLCPSTTNSARYCTDLAITLRHTTPHLSPGPTRTPTPHPLLLHVQVDGRHPARVVAPRGEDERRRVVGERAVLVVVKV